jgi:hypothetical protein
MLDYDAGWSEFTPGSGFSIGCSEGRFATLYGSELTDAAFRQTLHTAGTCPSYEPFQPAIQNVSDSETRPASPSASHADSD